MSVIFERGEKQLTYSRHGVDDDYIAFQTVLTDDEAVKLRDMLLDVYPLESHDWRKDGYFEEVSLENAKSGDIAEFVRTSNDRTYAGRLSRYGEMLCIEPEDFLNAPPFPARSWVIRNIAGLAGSHMRDLHIWRKIDPRSFKEPLDAGLYVSQSGRILFNDGCGVENWSTKDGITEPEFEDACWDHVRDVLDDSEFPLVKLDREQFKKIKEMVEQ